MIDKVAIIDILNLLDIKFISTKSHLEMSLYSKLSVLEYCGWLEETMDVIARKSFQNKVTNKNLIKFIEKKIKDTYNFKYKTFQEMLIYSVGLPMIENLEIHLGEQSLCDFKNCLRFYVTRNKFAHTFTAPFGVMQTSIKPSELITEANTIYPIFEKIYNFI